MPTVVEEDQGQYRLYSVTDSDPISCEIWEDTTVLICNGDGCTFLTPTEARHFAAILNHLATMIDVGEKKDRSADKEGTE